MSQFLSEVQGVIHADWKKKLNFHLLGYMSAGVLLIFAVSVIASDIVAIWRYSRSIIFFDQWVDLRYYKGIYQGHLSLLDLFDQHNEHRIFFPRLIMYLDYYLGHGIGAINISSIFLMQALHLSLLTWTYSKTNPSKVLLVAATAFGAMLMFSLGQQQNLFWGFQVSFVAIGFASSMSFATFTVALGRLNTGRPYWALIAAAYLLAAVATFTLANGVLTAVILILIALVMRAPATIIATTVIEFAGLTVAYFANFRPISFHTPYGYALSHPFSFLDYLFTYLGNPVAPLSRAFALGQPLGFELVNVVGSIGLASALAAAAFVLRRRDPPRIILVAVMFFALGTAILTALGRASLGQDQSIADRYLTPVSIFWLAQFLFWTSLLPRSAEHRLASRTGVAIITALFVGAVLIAHAEGWSKAKAHAKGLDYARAALLSQVNAPEAVKYLFPDPGRVLESIPFLREHDLSIFHSRDAHALSRPVEEAFSVVPPGMCSGYLDRVSPNPSAGVIAPDMEASGWAWNNVRHKAVERIVITDADGRVVGFGSGGYVRDDVHLPKTKIQAVGWQGFLRADSEREPFVAYAEMGGDKLCRLKQSAVP